MPVPTTTTVIEHVDRVTLTGGPAPYRLIVGGVDLTLAVQSLTLEVDPDPSEGAVLTLRLGRPGGLDISLDDVQVIAKKERV